MATDNKKKVSIDVAEFVRTRDALSSSYMSLSSAIDRAVKAYIEHTNVVLAGDASLNISYLTQPFADITAPQQLAQLALAQQNGTTPKLEDGEDAKGGRKKRAYKPRDPNAPKRPMTAYFRFLDVMRKPIAEEMAKSKPKDAGPSKPGDVSKEATVRWRAMSKEQQLPYKEAYQRSLKDYHKEVEEYKKKGGQVPDGDGTGAGEDEEEEEGGEGEGEDAKPAAAKKEGKKAEEESTDDEDEEEDSDDEDEDDASAEEDDEEAKPMPPPPPPKAPTPEPKKTPKSALKKNKKAKEPASSQDDVPPTPQFSSINPSAPVPSSSSKKEKSSSPELKRKAAPVAEEGEGKRKRKKAEKPAAEEKKVPESDASGDKPKKEKKKRRKSEAGS